MPQTAFRALPIAVLFAISTGGQTPPANGNAECRPGYVTAPAAASAIPAGAMEMANPKAAVVSATKKKVSGSSTFDSKADSVAVKPAAPRCLTSKSAATVAGGLGNWFHGDPSKDDMIRDLTAGRLYLDNISFMPGSEDVTPGSDKPIAILIDALKSADGRFVLKVTAESNGRTPADTELAQSRAHRILATLQSAGVPVAKVTPAPLTLTTSWNAGAPRKSDAHVELVALK